MRRRSLRIPRDTFIIPLLSEAARFSLFLTCPLRHARATCVCVLFPASSKYRGSFKDVVIDGRPTTSVPWATTRSGGCRHFTLGRQTLAERCYARGQGHSDEGA